MFLVFLTLKDLIMKKDSLGFLHHFPLFEGLHENEMEQLKEMVEFKTKPKFSYIFLPDEDAKYIYFLVKGMIKTGTHSNDGKEIIKSILHPFAMFGELCIIGEETRCDFAKAMNGEVHYFQLKEEDFKSLMLRNKSVGDKILKIIGQRLRKAENRLESLIFKDARTRIIEFLKDSARKRGRQVGYEMLVKHCLTQQDIANITGTSRQTVTSVLNELRKSNLIYFNRRSILIRDMAKLT